MRASLRRHLLWVGFAEALGAVAALACAGLIVAAPLGRPTPQLMRSLAEIGVALLLGYVVEAVWMAGRAKRRRWHENWLGNVCGVGVAGLMGIAAALLVAAHLESSGGGWVDDLGLWWAVASISLLGILVTLHPFVVDRWTRPGDDDRLGGSGDERPQRGGDVGDGERPEAERPASV